MTSTCSQSACAAPLTACNLGRSSLQECEFWRDHAKEREQANSSDTVVEPLLPWAGGSLGHLDLELVAARSLPRLIGIIGAHDAGKTTLLTSLYLLLWRGVRATTRSFAGSYTFGGWEDLAHVLRWHPGQPPQFPRHTSRARGRTPGLLHLSLRREDGVLEDVLFTDAPGEWFESWADNRMASSAEGARWTARHATALALVVDSAALAGPNRGLARARLLTLLNRLSDEIRPASSIAVVWSKSDILVPAQIRESLREAFEQKIPGYHEFRVTVKAVAGDTEHDIDGYIQLLNWLLIEQQPVISEPMPDPVDASDPFLAFRGGYV